MYSRNVDWAEGIFSILGWVNLVDHGLAIAQAGKISL